jgi:hypothetical protein
MVSPLRRRTYRDKTDKRRVTICSVARSAGTVVETSPERRPRAGPVRLLLGGEGQGRAASASREVSQSVDQNLSWNNEGKNAEWRGEDRSPTTLPRRTISEGTRTRLADPLYSLDGFFRADRTRSTRNL